MIDDRSSPQFGTRRESARPRDRISQLRFKKESKPDKEKFQRVRWEFKGVLENGARMRLHLSTVPKGWTTVQSGIRCYGAYMSNMHSHFPHFPAEYVAEVCSFKGCTKRGLNHVGLTCDQNSRRAASRVLCRECGVKCQHDFEEMNPTPDIQERFFVVVDAEK